MSQTSRYSAAHADPDGPGDARPTGLDIVEDKGREGTLADQVMLITGCSPGGLGVEVARALHLTGEISSPALKCAHCESLCPTVQNLQTLPGSL